MKRLEYRAIEVGLERLRGVSKNQLRSLVIYRRKRCDTTGVRVSPLAFLFIGSIKCLVPPHNVGLIPQMVGQLADSPFAAIAARTECETKMSGRKGGPELVVVASCVHAAPEFLHRRLEGSVYNVSTVHLPSQQIG